VSFAPGCTGNRRQATGDGQRSTSEPVPRFPVARCRFPVACCPYPPGNCRCPLSLLHTGPRATRDPDALRWAPTSMLSTMLRAIRDHALFAAGDRVLVAVSGGP